MKLLQKLDLFKIAIITILIMLIFILNTISKNGRFQYTGDNAVIDTRNGYVFVLESNDSGYIEYFKPSIPKKLN